MVMILRTRVSAALVVDAFTVLMLALVIFCDNFTLSYWSIYDSRVQLEKFVKFDDTKEALVGK